MLGALSLFVAFEIFLATNQAHFMDFAILAISLFVIAVLVFIFLLLKLVFGHTERQLQTALGSRQEAPQSSPAPVIAATPYQDCQALPQPQQPDKAKVKKLREAGYKLREVNRGQMYFAQLSYSTIDIAPVDARYWQWLDNKEATPAEYRELPPDQPAPQLPTPNRRR